MNQISISHKLEQLREYLGYLKEYQTNTLEEIKRDHTLQGALLRYLQLSIECTIDMGEIIISQKKLRKPQDNREVYLILAENKVIPKEFADKFSPVASFRNILVHEYAVIDLNQVYTHLQNDLPDFDFYAKCIAEHLNS